MSRSPGALPACWTFWGSREARGAATSARGRLCRWHAPPTMRPWIMPMVDLGCRRHARSGDLATLPRCVLGGHRPRATEADRPGERGSPFGIARRDHRVIRGQPVSLAVRARVEAVGRQMPLQGLVWLAVDGSSGCRPSEENCGFELPSAFRTRPQRRRRNEAWSRPNRRPRHARFG